MLGWVVGVETISPQQTNNLAGHGLRKNTYLAISGQLLDMDWTYENAFAGLWDLHLSHFAMEPELA
jgi:hypothetical protein